MWRSLRLAVEFWFLDEVLVDEVEVSVFFLTIWLTVSEFGFGCIVNGVGVGSLASNPKVFGPEWDSHQRTPWSNNGVIQSTTTGRGNEKLSSQWEDDYRS